MPSASRDGPFTSNIGEPFIFANNVLQLRFGAAATTFGRFVVNSTFGIGGLFDVASPEGIPTNILSDRLERLMQHQIIEQTPAADGTKRSAYRLTAKGEALRPMLKAMRDWGTEWEGGSAELVKR